MNQDIVLWVGGALVTVLVGLCALILRVIFQQGRDTNEKVTEFGSVSARLETLASTSAGEVARLRDQLDALRSEMSHISGAQELARQIVAAFSDATERRRQLQQRADER